MEKTPIFILGCPRSGTTLLSELLEPTAYGSPIETHFITKYFKKISQYGEIKEKHNFIKLMKDILSERPVMQWKLEIDIEKFWSDLAGLEYHEIVNQLCFIPFQSKKKASWGDKTPHYILDIDIIYKLFPDSKYIYIVRDGRDVALSLLRKPWGPNNVYSCAEYWKRCNAESPVFALMRERGQLFEVKYEDLLEYPDMIIKNIYTFLNETYTEEKLENLIDSVKRSNFNKWKTRMKPEDIKIFEMVASNTLKRLGYESSFKESEIKKKVRWFWQTHDAFFHFKHLIKINIIDTIRIKYFGMEPFAD